MTKKCSFCNTKITKEIKRTISSFDYNGKNYYCCLECKINDKHLEKLKSGYFSLNKTKSKIKINFVYCLGFLFSLMIFLGIILITGLNFINL